MSARQDYGAGAKWFHWLTVIPLTAQVALGWIMPDIHRGMEPEALTNLHLSLGMTILALGAARLAWRLFHGAPAPEPSLPQWQQRSAQSVHALLYLLIFLMTLTGWTFASMRGWPITVFGILPVPALVAKGSAIGRSIGQLHGLLLWVLLAAVAAHVAAALGHYFIRHDRVLQRMLPGRSPPH